MNYIEIQLDLLEMALADGRITQEEYDLETEALMEGEEE